MCNMWLSRFNLLPTPGTTWKLAFSLTVFGLFLGFLILAILSPTEVKGWDFFQHFQRPGNYAYPGWVSTLLAHRRFQNPENYAYPGWVSTLMAPLQLLEPSQAFAIFLLLSAIALAYASHREGMIWLLVWPVSLYGLWEGNFIPLVLFGAIVGFRLWSQGRKMLALLPFALVLLKPHLALGFLLWLGIEIWRRRLMGIGVIALMGLFVYALATIVWGTPGSRYFSGWFLRQGFSFLSLLPVWLKVPAWALGLALLGLWLAGHANHGRLTFITAWAWGVSLSPYFQVQDLILFALALSALVEKNRLWIAVLVILGLARWLTLWLIPLSTTLVAMSLLFKADASGGKISKVPS